MREKAEKRKLEQRLHAMSSQLIVGGKDQTQCGAGVEDSVAFRTALRREHERIHGEYVKRLEELERERQVVTEDKVQIDRCVAQQSGRVVRIHGFPHSQRV